MNKDRQKYQTNYMYEHYRQFLLRFDLEKDKEIVKKLDKVPNKTEYVRQLINKDLASKK